MENWINKIFKLLGEIEESLRVNHWIKMIREAKGRWTNSQITKIKIKMMRILMKMNRDNKEKIVKITCFFLNQERNFICN